MLSGSDIWTGCLGTEIHNFTQSFPTFQIPPTTVRILLNHFKWDKEKLMEKYYTEKPEKLFEEAQVVSPFKTKESKVKGASSSRSTPAKTYECDICYLAIPKSVSTENGGQK